MKCGVTSIIYAISKTMQFPHCYKPKTYMHAFPAGFDKILYYTITIILQQSTFVNALASCWSLACISLTKWFTFVGFISNLIVAHRNTLELLFLGMLPDWIWHLVHTLNAFMKTYRVVSRKIIRKVFSTNSSIYMSSWVKVMHPLSLADVHSYWNYTVTVYHLKMYHFCCECSFL